MSIGSGMGKLPEGWEWATLGDVTLKKVEQVKRVGPLTYIDIGSIDSASKSVTNPQELAEEQNIPSRARQVVEKNDVIVSMTRPNLNAVAMISGERHGAIASTGFDVLRAIELEPNWIFNVVKSNGFVDSMSSIVQGALYPAIRPSDVRGYRIPVPPKDEQKRIIQAIESLQEHIARTHALLAEIKPLIDQYRQSVLRSAFSGRLTADWRAKQNTPLNKIKIAAEPAVATKGGADKVGRRAQPFEANSGGSPQSIDTRFETAKELLQRIRTERRQQWEADQLVDFKAKGKKPTKGWQDKYKEPDQADESVLPILPGEWCWVTIEELLLNDGSLSYGILKPGDSDPNGVPMIRIKDVGDFGLKPNAEVMKVSKELSEQYKRTELHPGDIILAVMATIGRAAIVPAKYEGANVNRALAVLKLTKLVSPEYIVAVIRSPFFQDRFMKEKVGTAQARINLGDLRKFAVPLCCPSEAARVVEKVNEAISLSLNVDEILAVSQSSLTQLDQSILSKAFRGELASQDPNDEPASELLARICASRITNKPSTKKKKAPTKKTAKKKVSSQKSAESVKNTQNRLRDWIMTQEVRKTFTFEQMENSMSVDYESLKEMLFVLLDEQPPSLQQVFDKKTKRIAFRRVSK